MKISSEQREKEYNERWQAIADKGTDAILLELCKQIERQTKAINKLFLSQKDTLNVDEASEYIDRPKKMLYFLTADREISFFKKNSVTYFDRKELENDLKDVKFEKV